jgi:hypothetical protein
MGHSGEIMVKKTLRHPGVADRVPSLAAAKSSIDTYHHKVLAPTGRLRSLVLF